MKSYFDRVIDKVISVLNKTLFKSESDSHEKMWARNEPDQLSVRTSGEALEKGYDYKGSVFMFVEDMHNTIMPFLHVMREGGQTFDATVDPANHAIEEIITEGLVGRDHFRGLPDALCDFVRHAAQTLFYTGLATYEIVRTKNDKNEYEGFYLVPIYPLSLKKFLGNYYQIVPSSERKVGVTKTGIIRIPKEKILCIEMPKELGGQRKLRKMLKRLYKLSQKSFPDFHVETMRKGKNIGFNLKEYDYEKYLEQAFLTKAFGWNQRRVPDENILEHYSLRLRLKKVRAQAIVREKIIESINQALNGPLLNLHTKIVVKGIWTKTESEEELARLNAGDVEFINIFNRTLN